MVIHFHHVDFFKEAARAANERCRKLCLDVPVEENLDSSSAIYPRCHQQREELRDSFLYSCEMREASCEMQDIVAPGVAARVVQGLLPQPMSAETMERGKQRAAISTGESRSGLVSHQNSFQRELEAPIIDEQVSTGCFLIEFRGFFLDGVFGFAAGL